MATQTFRAWTLLSKSTTANNWNQYLQSYIMCQGFIPKRDAFAPFLLPKSATGLDFNISGWVCPKLGRSLPILLTLSSKLYYCPTLLKHWSPPITHPHCGVHKHFPEWPQLAASRISNDWHIRYFVPEDSTLVCDKIWHSKCDKIVKSFWWFKHIWE